MGQTLVKRLGVNAASALMRKVKPGCIVEVAGSPHPNRKLVPPPLARSASDEDDQNSDEDDESSSEASLNGAEVGEGTVDGRQSGIRQVLDVVCHSVDVLHDNIGAAKGNRKCAPPPQ